MAPPPDPAQSIGLLRHFPEPAVVTDGRGRIVALSEAAAELFDRPVHQLIGHQLAEFLPGPERSLAALAEVMSLETPALSGTEPLRLDLGRPDGSVSEVDVKLAVVGGDEDRLVVASMRAVEPFVTLDVPGEVSRCLEVGGRLADQLTSAPSMEDAFAVLLPSLCSSLTWDAAALWLAGSQGRLACTATWPSDGGSHTAFEWTARRASPTDEHLVARALSAEKPQWGRLGDGILSAPEEEAASTSGLLVSVAVPLVGRQDAHGVVQFLTGRDEPVTTRLRGALGTLGRQIGYLLDDVRARSKAREGERLRGFLLEAATAIVGTTDYAAALTRLAAVSVPELADLCLIDVKEPHGVTRRMAAIHADPEKKELVEELGRSYPPVLGGLHPSTAAMEHGRSSWSPTMPDEFLRATTRDDRHFELVKALGFESFMCVPLRSDDEILGSITLVSAGSGRRFREEDLALPQELARRAASIVAAARRFEQQHRLTGELQRLLLPDHLPQTKHVELCVRYVPAAADAAAGGDFYDFVELPSARIGVVIGDIEGHDTPAAATMGQLRSAIRALAGQVREPGQLIDALRWSWDLLGFERTATALLARLDHESGEVVVASAGHLPPVVIRPELPPRIVELDVAPPFGSPSSLPARDHAFQLEEDETLFLFTDGLIEQRGVPLDESLEHLVSRLNDLKGERVETICDEVLSYFGQRENPSDDVAVLAMRRLPAQG